MITVTYVGGDRLRIKASGHELFADQPVQDGGAGSAPTPTELFVASLAACIAHYAQRFLRRHKLSTEGLRVECSYTFAKNPNRVGTIDLQVDAPGLTDDKREAFERVIEHCTVHNTLRQEPDIRLRISPARSAVA